MLTPAINLPFNRYVLKFNKLFTHVILRRLRLPFFIFFNQLYLLVFEGSMPKLQKVLSSIVTLATVFSFSGFGLVASAEAAQLTNASIVMSSSIAGATGVSHQILFDIASGGNNLQEVDLQYSTTPSGSATMPTNLALGASSLDGSANSGNAASSDATSNWALDKTNSATGLLKLTRTAGAVAVTTSEAYQFTINGIGNNDETSACDAVANSDSCFIRITTKTTTGGTVLDTSTISYTVVDAVQVTATVDPILTFTVTGVSGTSLQDSSNVGSGTGVTTTSTTLPFANVTVGTPKIAQQQLNTETNDNNGYFVYGKFITTGNVVMKGLAVTSNVISKFIGSASNATWASPKAWASPTGTTQNINSAWLGVRTSDTDVANFGTTNFYAPPDVLNDTVTGQAVSKSTGPDNGTSPIYVTFKIEANAFQPADQYAGTWQYNVVPSY